VDIVASDVTDWISAIGRALGAIFTALVIVVALGLARWGVHPWVRRRRPGARPGQAGTRHEGVRPQPAAMSWTATHPPPSIRQPQRPRH
jgi:hypothetical protein